MFLASRVSMLPIQQYDAVIPNQAQTSNAPQFLAQTATEVNQEKEASRARILDEIQKITKLANKFRTLSLNDISRSAVTQIEAQLTTAHRDLSSAVYHAPLYANQQ
ncbi:hypothetical protein FRC02_002127 [Tulasnella sp. 418]|nr:hypothetical protein FRC02_002127 [Tulasnella sp. 418]